MFYLTYYLMGLILIPGIIYSIIVSSKVQSTFKTFSTVASKKGITAKEASRIILQNAGITDVEIKPTSGNLTDNYNPSNKTLNLSEPVYNSTSISALGVAAHEAGHAIQHAEGYAYLKVRSFLVVLNNIASSLLWPMVIIGIILSALAYTAVGNVFLWIGVGTFALSMIVSLVTLPVEFNASKRALTCLVNNGILDQTEVKASKLVLDAAAKTYVAGLVVSILALLRFVLAILVTRDE